MDMSGKRPPKIGLPIVDNLIAAAWVTLAGLNLISASVFADLMVGLGALATFLLTLFRIYEHLVGEPISDTVFGSEQEAQT